MEEVVLVHEAEFEANPTGMNRERLQKVQAELIKCLALEEKYWQQKAGMTWFKEGDKNTKLFHAQVREEAIKFYEEQFTEAATPSSFDIIEHVPNLINTDQNAELIKQPTKEEVIVAVLGLNGDSAGGPDGMTGKFYHSCWDIIGDDLYDMSGFVKGRNIVENILLTQEIVTNIRLRTKAGPNVILMLDMTKAYDRLSWLFLTKVLRKMGFIERLIGIVFGLVSNNLYSILINGQAHGFFKSSRGVKQGDPVSPTLFILAIEALSRGLNALHTNLYFCGFGMPKWSPKINHLAYADDMIIFLSSDLTSLMLIMQVLNAYEVASGQLVNKTKSVVYLQHLTNMEVVSKVERITGIHRNDFPIIYLGCPIFYARRKLEYYQPLITKVMDKLQSWQGLGALYFLVPQDFGIDETVHNVYDVTLDGEWDVDRLFEMLPEDLTVHILEKIKPPSPQQVLDMPCWMLETRGYFSVKSAWDYMRRRDEPRTSYRMIWGDLSSFIKYPALVKVRKPGMDMVPHKWQDLLAMMENFTPKLKVTKVMWEFPSAGWLKVNTDGASMGNPGRSSIGFCIRNENGDIVKSVGKEIEETTNTVAEAKAMVEALRFCKFQQYCHVWLQTDSMLLKKIMGGIWKSPWIISEQVEEMMQLMNEGNYTVTHILKEGNKLIDHLANYALDHGEIECQQFWHLDAQGRRLVNKDKLQCPSLRVKVDRR
ncbi:uncharacterized protein LOC142180789 [Nicotiana tabacum]|uniref:Uncharacterized protein LOC142180789 n=1 Tax=Nicotiana tabacum TaxID=4097 RepID=A0AC58UIA0_TOBAC